MSVVKFAKLGAGFAALQRIGLGEKALIQHAGSDWLKNTVPKIPKITQVQKALQPELPIHGLPILKMKELNRFGSVNPWSKR